MPGPVGEAAGLARKMNYGVNMTKIILHGACGRMGRMITDIVRKDEDSVIVA